MQSPVSIWSTSGISVTRASPQRKLILLPRANERMFAGCHNISKEHVLPVALTASDCCPLLSAKWMFMLSSPGMALHVPTPSFLLGPHDMIWLSLLCANTAIYNFQWWCVIFFHLLLKIQVYDFCLFWTLIFFSKSMLCSNPCFYLYRSLLHTQTQGLWNSDCKLPEPLNFLCVCAPRNILSS